MLDSSTCFGDLFPGDQFDSDKLACAGLKRYVRLSPTFEKGIGGYANAVELNTGEPALFQPEDRVTLVR
jgi:hypothetical protein